MSNWEYIEKYVSIARRLRMASLASILLGLVGCSPPQASELFGTYRANYKSGTEILELRADGTYLQTAKHKSGKTLTATGKWTYPFANSNVLELDDALSVDFEAPNAPIANKANWGLNVSKQFSKISLVYDDEGGHFEKTR